MKIDSAATIVDCLEHYYREIPDAAAYTFLPKGVHDTQSVTYSSLVSRSKSLANVLLHHRLEGKNVILTFPPGIDFIIALYACFYAGCIAIPTNLSRSSQHAKRLNIIINDAGVDAVLTTEELSQTIGSQLMQADAIVLSTNGANTTAQSLAKNRDHNLPSISNESIAFIQYTSGSTSSPKGVMVSHANLLSNIRAIRDTFGTHEHIKIGGWLPQFHDMGLIGHILHAGAVGGHYAFISPLSFITRPQRWLQLMSDYKCQISSAPNFAYDLCNKRIPDECMSSFDLTSWRWACNGAEPVSPTTIRLFSERFSNAGFSPTAMTPCYGLAEATLMISASNADAAPRFINVLSSGLEKGRLILSNSSGKETKTLVCCGRIAPGHEVRIVDPESHECCAEHEIGEIWIKGPSVAQGYWNKPCTNRIQFRAKAVENYTTIGSFLRTGDIGALHEDQLVITGRIKDVIIVRGRNIYPHDIERTTFSYSPLLRDNRSAAFALGHQVIVIAEVNKGEVLADELTDLKLNLSREISTNHEVVPHDILFIKSNSLPITSSGKIQRNKCKQLYINNNLEPVAQTTVAVD
jgi:acyl-CoA synthetase (AMP-forming)/AMP-acid ligase II